MCQPSAISASEPNIVPPVISATIMAKVRPTTSQTRRSLRSWRAPRKTCSWVKRSSEWACMGRFRGAAESGGDAPRRALRARGRWVAAAGKEEAAASRAAANQGGNASSRVSQGNSHEHGRSLARGGARRKRKLAQRSSSWTTFHLTLKHILYRAWKVLTCGSSREAAPGGHGRSAPAVKTSHARYYPSLGKS